MKMSESHNNFNIKNFYDKQDVKKKKDYGLYLVLSLVGVLLLTAIVLLPIFLSNISHSKKSQSGYYIRNKYANKYIDLHLHLDGAITLDIAKKLASLQNIELPTDNDEELEKLLSVPDDCESLNDFLQCFELPLTLLQTPEGLTEAVRLVSDNIQSQGVIYAEIRWAPQLHTDNGMTQEDAIKAALEGLKKTKPKNI